MGNCGCENKCNCGGCSTLKTGDQPSNFIRVQTVTPKKSGETFAISKLANQVDVCGDFDVTLTLPKGPRVGRNPLVINNTGNGTTTLKSPDCKIAGQDDDGGFDLLPFNSGLATFTNCDTDPCGCGSWAILADREPGDGTTVPVGCVKNIAALAAANVGTSTTCYRMLVESVDQYWELDRTSTAKPDGITIVAAQKGGNWLRLNSFSKKWSLQLTWYVDPIAGNDENNGASISSPTKTVAEVNRRLTLLQAGRNYQLNILNDVPLQESVPRPFADPSVLISDEFRPSYVEDQNNESILTGGVEQVVNMTVLGREVQSVIGTFTMGTFVATSAAAQATITGLSPADAALLAANIGAFLRDPATGATSIVGNVSGTTARVTTFSAPGAPALGAPVQLVRKTQWNPSLIQVGNSQGRWQWQDIEFPAAASAADQQNIAQRTVSCTYLRCMFRRVWALDFNCASTLNGCSAIFPVPTVIPILSGAFTYANSMFYNVSLRAVGMSGFLQMFGMYIQNGNVQTYTNTGFPTYGAAIAANATIGNRIQIVGEGLSVYDWPAGLAPTDLNAGLLVSDDATVRLGGGLRGSSTNPNTVGVLVRSSSKLLILDSVTPTIAGASGEVILQSPTQIASNLAMHTTPHPIIAGAVGIAADPMTLWSDWTGAPFDRYAFQLDDGSRISSIRA